jgi:hypothetical protein
MPVAAASLVKESTAPQRRLSGSSLPGKRDDGPLRWWPALEALHGGTTVRLQPYLRPRCGAAISSGPGWINARGAANPLVAASTAGQGRNRLVPHARSNRSCHPSMLFKQVHGRRVGVVAASQVGAVTQVRPATRSGCRVSTPPRRSAPACWRTPRRHDCGPAGGAPRAPTAVVGPAACGGGPRATPSGRR